MCKRNVMLQCHSTYIVALAYIISRLIQCNKTPIGLLVTINSLAYYQHLKLLRLATILSLHNTLSPTVISNDVLGHEL